MAHDRSVPVVEMRGVRKYYREADGFRHTYNRAVDGVDLAVYPGETFGIVGESGCGKSTAARLMMGLEKPTEGEIFFRGERVDTMPERRLRAIRPKFQMVFQDSGSSLNPRKRVSDILTEPMIYHGAADRRSAGRRAEELLSLVGLPAEAGGRYPHEFSGGQRQRICIARALSLKPELVILDEPVSALDVSVQAQILNLLRDLQQELHLTCIFIGHGLGAVRYVSRRIAVMYRGRVVECAQAEALFSSPAHPYSRALLDAAPAADFAARNRPRIALRGEASGHTPQGGCLFRDRCPEARAECASVEPELQPIRDGGHLSACPYSR